VLFEQTPEVYYKEPQFIIYYKPYQRLIPLSLTDNSETGFYYAQI